MSEYQYIDFQENHLIELLRTTNRCRPEVKELADKLSGLDTARYDALAVRLTEQSEDHALGILLNVAAVNKIKFDPHVLAKSLEILHNIIDFTTGSDLSYHHVTG